MHPWILWPLHGAGVNQRPAGSSARCRHGQLPRGRLGGRAFGAFGAAGQGATGHHENTTAEEKEGHKAYDAKDLCAVLEGGLKFGSSIG